MTELLQQVISEIQKLPAEQQNAIASRLMAELRDEQRWTEQFESTTDEQWDRLADLVRQEITGHFVHLARWSSNFRGCRYQSN
jgi:hypothetical protein